MPSSGEVFKRGVLVTDGCLLLSVWLSSSNMELYAEADALEALEACLVARGVLGTDACLLSPALSSSNVALYSIEALDFSTAADASC
jgi:hypothetical protein